MDHHDKLFDLGLREANKEEACLAKIKSLRAEKDELPKRHVGPNSAEFIAMRVARLTRRTVTRRLKPPSIGDVTRWRTALQ